jgi:hypothetical protein
VKSKRLIYFLFLVAVVSGLVVLLLVRQSEEDRDVAEAKAETQSDKHQEDVTSLPEKAHPEAGVKKRTRRRPRLPKNAIDKTKRAEVLALILSALQEKEARKEKKHSRESLKPTGLPVEYVREAVREIVPLLKECYHMELEERGAVSGKIVLGFDLVAHDEHGGLVEEASVLETELSKEISDSFAECLRETLYAIRLEAPEWSGRHTIRYPVIFSASR